MKEAIYKKMNSPNALNEIYKQANIDSLLLIEKYWRDKHIYRFSIPFNELDEKQRDFYIKIFAEKIVSASEAFFNIELQYYQCYNCKKVVFFKAGDEMEYRLTVEIPYMSRSDYYDLICKINNLVDHDGFSTLFANNEPNNLQIFLTIETNSNYEEIKQLVDENNLKILNSKGFDELIAESITFRRYNCMALPKPLSSDIINGIFEPLCFFAEKKDLEEQGYILDKEIEKPKIFISYPHGSKEIVHSVTDYLEKIGVNIWIDKKELLPGDNILDGVLHGFKECDMFLLFISKSTLKADFAKFEILEAMNKVIYHKKEWFIVKIDDVEPNDIHEGLRNYMYYDFSINKDIEDLAKTLSKKIDKISKSKL